MADGTQIFKKDDIVETTITDIGSSGEGIGKVDGYTLFIKDAVIGDAVTAKIIKAGRTYGYARLMNIVKPSPFRVAPRCEIARACGGCQIQALAYDQQLAFKQKKVRDDLIRIGGFDEKTVDQVMHPIVGMEDPFHYRNKAQIPVGRGKDGSLVAGFYAGRTHVIVPVSTCYIGAPENQEIVAAVLDYMRDCNVAPYDEKTGKGLMRHIMIRSGLYSQEIMVCLVVNGKSLPHEDRLIERLSVLPHMTGICLNVNTARTNVIMGRKVRVLWGKGYIQDCLHVFEVEQNNNVCPDERKGAGDAEISHDVNGRQAVNGVKNPNEAAGAALAGDSQVTNREGDITFTPTGRQVQFNISPLSFYQVNPRQAEKLYSIALHYADLHGTETVWDLYCGVGTISLFVAGYAKEVYGVEAVPEAIEDAKKNAALNGIDNVLFEAGLVEEVIPAYLERRRKEGKKSGADVVIVDPPRKGCDEKMLDAILQTQPPRVVYVSCDPATLARDLKVLAAGGYTLRAVTPVDQFGHTVHVETVVLISRVEGK